MAINTTLAITYAGVTIGAGGNYFLENIEIQKDEKSLTVEFSAIISEATEAAMYTRISTLEAAFRKRDQDLVLDRGSSSETFSHSDNTGLNMTPQIKEIESEYEGTAREFRCSVSLALPEDGNAPDPSGEQGLRNYSVKVSKLDSKKREINMQGVYTALSGNDAIAQYQDQIGTLSTTVKNDVDAAAEWELIDESYEKDRQDKFCVWSRTYIENLAKQSVAQTDVPEIRNVQLVASVLDNAPGDSDAFVAGSRPITVAVSYSCSVDKETTTDLETVFNNSIKPRMIEYGKDVGNGSVISVSEIDFKPNQGANTIEASMVMVVYGGGTTISIEASQSDFEVKGIKLEPVDDGESVFAADIIPSRGSITRKSFVSVVVLGTIADARVAADSFPFADRNEIGAGDGAVPGLGGSIGIDEVPEFGAKGGVFVPLTREEIDAATSFVGILPNQQQLSAVTVSITSEYFVQAKRENSNQASPNR